MSDAHRTYYPSRFRSARFYDAKRGKYIEVPLHEEEEDDELPDFGRHSAAVGANKKKRKQTSTVNPADRQSLSVLENNVSLPVRQADLRKVIQRTQARVLRDQLAKPTFDPRYIHTTPEIAWRTEQVELVERIALSMPMLSACISTLKKLVMADGLVFRRDNIELIPSRDFKDYVVQRLYPFAFDCIDSLLLLGIIPIAYAIDPNSGQCWPYVPARGSYTIKRHTVFGAVQYRFYWSSKYSNNSGWQRRQMSIRDKNVLRFDGRLDCNVNYADDDGGMFDPTVTIAHNLGYELLADGGLTSKVATLIVLAHYRMRIERSRVVAEANASAPPMVFEFDSGSLEKSSQNFREGYFADAGAPTTFADGGERAESIESMTYQRTVEMRQSYAQILRHYEHASGRDAATEFGVGHEEYRSQLGGTASTQPDAKNGEGLPARWRDTFHINPMHKLANLPPVSVSGDYVSVLQYFDGQVCAVMGVPESYVLGVVDGRAGTEIVTNRLGDEVRSLKNAMTDILTHVHNKIFLEEDIGDYVRESSARRRRDGEVAPTSLTTENLRVTNDIRQTVLTFAKTPSETPDELKIMYALKGIDKHTYMSELARRNGFDPAQLCTNRQCDDDDDENEDDEDEDEKREFFAPELIEYRRMRLEEQKHKDGIKLQREQAAQQQEMQTEQLASKEKQASTAAKAKASSSGGSGGEKKKKSLGEQSQEAGWSGPSLSEISSAATVLANAGAAAKKKKKEEGEQKTKRARSDEKD